ncbi:MAG: MerR family transcriptional regulator [Beijerinckiaceae bacterium]
MTNLFERTGHSNSGSRFTGSATEYMTISQMARQFDVSLRTLRFYEDRGLLSPLRHGTMRLYDGRQRMRLEMILKGKRLGFTLTEIREMLGTHGREEPPEIESTLEPEQIVTHIGMLERQREVLDTAIRELRATHERILTGPELQTGNAI